MVTKWVTLGIYNREHHPSLHENTKKRKRENTEARGQRRRENVFTEFAGRQRWNIKRDERREERNIRGIF